MGSSAPPSTTTNGVYHTMTTFPPPKSGRPTILHLGDPIQYNRNVYDRLVSQFNIIRPSDADLERSVFVRHLRQRTWGDFSAIMRPFWSSGNMMKPWNKELIELLPDSMRVMASAGAGYDWVNVRCLAEHGIIYCNGGRASTESVADTAIYHIISVFRHMTASSLAARSCSPERWSKAHNHIPTISHNPRDHTLGIVGLGNIGFAIAVKAHAAFGMKILYTDISRKTVAQESQVDATYFPEMTDMLPDCDCVLLATPAGPRLLTDSTIRLLPRGARVVNIGRGSLIDETALAEALESRHIGAAGLDVHEKEPQVNKRLARMDNVELTSHTGGGSVETNIMFERLSMENCEAVLNGRDPLTAVNLPWMRSKANVVGKGDDDRRRDGGGGGGFSTGMKQDDSGKKVEGDVAVAAAAATATAAADAATGAAADAAAYSADNSSDNATLASGTQGVSLVGKAQLETMRFASASPPPVKKVHDADHTNGIT